MASPTSSSDSNIDVENLPTLFGHPTALFTLFFAEMWERFSYYGMRALLVFYMIKGFLGYSDGEAYRIYGAYAGMVYMTPFFGGMIADRLLGTRRAVILGGVLMGLGHLAMGVEESTAFYVALALLIVGNGFFKPNISTMLGTLYGDNDPRQDGGFTIFYMGINLGAAMAPLLCGYVGETYGWHHGFRLATMGMMVGLAVFVVPTVRAQVLIMLGALATLFMFTPLFMEGITGTAFAMPGIVEPILTVIATVCIMAGGYLSGVALDESEESKTLESTTSSKRVAQVILVGSATPTAIAMVFMPDSTILIAVMAFVALALMISVGIAVMALEQGGLPGAAGRAPDYAKLKRKIGGVLPMDLAVYLGAFLIAPLFAVLVASNRTFKVIPESVFAPLTESTSALLQVGGTVLAEMSTLPGLILVVTGIGAVTYLMWESFRSSKMERERLWVVVVLMFFSMLFWAFFEQGGSSMNNFTDRNVDRVQEEQVVDAGLVGQSLTITINQEQLGRVNADPAMKQGIADALREIDSKREAVTGPERTARADKLAATVDFVMNEPALTLTGLDALRDTDQTEQTWKVGEDNIGMGMGGTEIPASTYQSANAIFIVIFGLVFTGMWSYLGARGREPSTPVKFALGLAQLGLGFLALWWGAEFGDDGRGMTHMGWLLLAYLLFTTGELCLSPVGLSMVTKLSPTRLVSTAMGAWFLATAFSSLLASIIATFTGVSHGGGASAGVPVPSETLHVYGDVFGVIACLIAVATIIMLALSPLLNKWTHTEPTQAA
jgi:dipeptide/tripeptide permease